MNQRRSRRILAAIGLATVLAAVAPLLWQQWLEFSESRGKTGTVVATSPLSERKLMACLLKREAGSLALQVYGENHFADPAREIAVEIVDRGTDRQIVAWNTPENPLRPSELKRIKTCSESA